MTVVNKNDAARTVTVKDDGGFDVEVPAGETVSFTSLEESGDYEVLCFFHPKMSATLVVQRTG